LNFELMWLSLLVLLLCFTLLWLLSLELRDASIVDLFWGPAFVVAAGVYFATTDGWLPRRLLVVGLVTLWALRLAAHLAARNLGHGEDVRYRRWRDRHGRTWWWRSLLQVFLLQAGVAWVVSWPLLAAQSADGPGHWTRWDAAGTLLFAAGLTVETAADRQLRRFKARGDSRAQVLDSGLWRYSRHPNYFGEAVVWWGLFLIAAGVPGGWMTLASPLLMTWLLTSVSGVPLLEAGLAASRPGYADYVARTSAFVPWPPRRVRGPEHRREWKA
jgi:steroid 5-alpha reductase family enzyme